MSVETAINYLAGVVGALPGMKQAPTAPIESPGGVFPFAVTYEYTGTFQAESGGFGHDLVTLFVDIHVQRFMLPESIALAMSFREPFLKALIADPTLGGSVSTFNEVRHTFGEMMYNNTKTIGYRFEIDIKVSVEV